MILKLLYPDKELMLTEIMSAVKPYGVGQSAVYSTLKAFLENDIVSEREGRTPRNVLRLFRLTEKGRRLAREIIELEKRLENP